MRHARWHARQADAEGGALRTGRFDLDGAARFHDLRHTAATLMLSAGVHPKVVSEMLGHSSVAITLDRYSHVVPTMQEEAALRIDQLLGVA